MAAEQTTCIADDSRTDPRLLASLIPLGLAKKAAVPPVNGTSPLEAIIGYHNAAEPMYQSLFASLFLNYEVPDSVERSTEVIKGVDDNDITLFITRPKTHEGPLPAILHLHGGGMGILQAADVCYASFRDALAAAGCIVVGVEFRNSCGVGGPHPFPAGLNDCASALEWLHQHRADMLISKIIVNGESGGGNLTLATTLKAKSDGKLSYIDGTYANCPFIGGPDHWAARSAEFPSMRECDGYFLDLDGMAAMGTAYVPNGEHKQNPLAFPTYATEEQLGGLPPHTISVNELDPLRDEGLSYHRRLLKAGTSSVGRIVVGTTHAADISLHQSIPDIFNSTVRDIVGFANSL